MVCVKIYYCKCWEKKMNFLLEEAQGTDIMASANNLGFEVAMIVIVACVVLAFFAIRLYKMLMCAFGAVGIGYVAFSLLKEGGLLGGYLPTFDWIDLPVAIGLGAAVVGIIVGVLLPKFVLFLGGIGIGCFATPLVANAFFPGILDDTILLIAGVIIGMIIGILLSLLFKPVYSFITSIGCMAIAGAILVVIVFPGTNILFGAGGGAVIGIIPMICQFRVSEEDL